MVGAAGFEPTTPSPPDWVNGLTLDDIPGKPRRNASPDIPCLVLTSPDVVSSQALVVSRMVANRRITRDLVDALRPGNTAWDPEVRGFGVRRQRRDAVYLVKLRDKDGRQRIITIGRDGPGEWSPDRARREAIRIKGLARDGLDLAAERDRARAAPSLSEFAARYMAEYASVQKKPRTVAEDCGCCGCTSCLPLGI